MTRHKDTLSYIFAVKQVVLVCEQARCVPQGMLVTPAGTLRAFLGIGKSPQDQLLCQYVRCTAHQPETPDFFFEKGVNTNQLLLTIYLLSTRHCCSSCCLHNIYFCDHQCLNTIYPCLVFEFCPSLPACSIMAQAGAPLCLLGTV